MSIILKELSVIMPAYNEEATVLQSINQVLKLQKVKELIIIDDGSTDNTQQILGSIKGSRIKVITHKTNLGKGAAVRRGIREASGDYILIQDADLEYDTEDIPNLIKPFQKGRAQVVYGSRFTGPRKNMFFWHFMGNKLLSLIVNILYNTTLSDMETCYKLIPTKLARELNLRQNDFSIEPEITCKLLKRGVFIFETPISYHGRTYEEGKKITWKDGFKALYVIFRERF